MTYVIRLAAIGAQLCNPEGFLLIISYCRFIMKIQISPERTIGEVQDAFREAYPFLQIVFFSKPHRVFKGSHAKYLIHDRDQQLGAIMAESKEGFLTLEPNMPPFHAERLLEDEFGLYVQVMRKSGDTWLVTSVTDSLTLEQQNAKGRAGENVHFLPPDEMDYREQE
ncbi:MAG: hypothetical protein IPM98_04825 [Lewinellaceae bacterium]|nr:hypothetical protein [Lewinellaceae bacterium]